MLKWQHRIARIQVRERELFRRWASGWRVIRTSNAYVFNDPLQSAPRPEDRGSYAIPPAPLVLRFRKTV